MEIINDISIIENNAIDYSKAEEGLPIYRDTSQLIELSMKIFPKLPTFQQNTICKITIDLESKLLRLI